MPTWTLLVLYTFWVIASAAIAIAAGGFVAIAADSAGIAPRTVSVLFDVVTVLVFVSAGALPFLLHLRSPGSNSGDQG